MALQTTRRRVSLLSWVLGVMLQVSLPLSIIAALLSTLVLAATLAHLFLDYVLDPQQVVLLGWATMIGLVLGAVGIASMLYRWWLILRRRRPFRWRDEVTDQLLNVPDYAQDAAQQLPQLANRPGRIATVGSAVSRPGSAAAAAITIQPIATAVVVLALAPAIVLGGPPTLVPSSAVVGASSANASPTPTPHLIATATAQATATPTTQPLVPYTASRLGPCDGGGGYWLNWGTTTSTTFDSADYTCLPDSLKLTYLASENRRPTETQLAFVDQATYAHYATPANLPSLRVLNHGRIDLDLVNLSANATFTIFFLGGYYFSLDPSGNWASYIPDGSGFSKLDKSGTRTGATSLHLTVVRQGGSLTYEINGATVTTSQAGSNPYQGFLLTIGNGDSSVQLKNFVYTPLA